MAETRRLFYIFKGKVETEEVNRWDCSARARQIYGCTLSQLFMLEPDGKFYSYNFSFWKEAESVPDEVKLAYMLST